MFLILCIITTQEEGNIDVRISDLVDRDNRVDTSGWINVYNKDRGLENE